MQLKKLELFGFKSFADRTKFNYGPGVTVIVGPNGCGKSNVVDSMKWVLGEQSAKSLRGSEMLDVIFNGSKNRKPLGFAEATLTFTNTKGIIHPDLNDIAITRRLHRDGQSEYMINRKSCRLKDIRELFMDTGVGLRAYSIIEQGRIDAFLQASPTDRRLVFEEAAGISKYKARKKEALRKLDRVGHNLDMISVNIVELEKRLRSLKNQAGRARSFQEASERLRKLRVALSLHHYHSASKDFQRVSGDLVLAAAQLEDLKAAIAVKEGEVGEADEKLREYDGKIATKQVQHNDLENEYHGNNERIRGNQQAVEALKTEEIRLQERTRDCRERVEAFEQELVTLTERRSVVEAQAATLVTQMASLKRELGEIEGNIAQAEEGIQKGKSEIVDLYQTKSRCRNDLEKVKGRISELTHRRAAVDAERESTVKQREKLSARQEVLAEEIERLQERSEVLKHEYEELETRENELTDAIAGRRETVTRLEETHLRVSSRIEVLEGYRDRFEGVNEGARQVIEAGRKEEPEVDGVKGLLVDRIRVEEKFARAIEEALGGDNCEVLVDDYDAAVTAVDFLRTSKKGRGTFVPVAGDADLPEDDADLDAYPGVLGRAVDFVEADEEVRDILRRRLGWTLVVETLAVASGLRAMFRGYDFVTLQGEVLRSDGTLRGGAATMGRISHAAEIEKLTGRAGQLAASLTEERNALATLQAELSELKARFKDVKEQRYDVGMQYAHAKDDLVECRKQLAEQEDRLGVLEGELTGIDADAERAREEQAGLEKAVADLDAREEQVKERLNALDREIAALAEEEETLKSEQHRLEADKIRADMELESLETGRRRVEKEMAERRQLMADYQEELGQKAARRQEILAENDALNDRMEQLTREISTAKQELEFLRNIQDDLEQEKSLKTSQLKEKRAVEETLAGKVNGLKVDEERLKLVLDNIVVKCRDELDVDVPDLYSEFDDEREDWEDLEAEAERLRTKIKNLGNVNVDAIREFEEVQARYDYLSEQRDDLLSARTQITGIIRQIDRKSKVLFTETFSTIRENFKVIFKQLFEGGRADIVLTEEGNVLDSPIDIIAQPKDKKPASITLLSGGEKVMTCIALLFAIFKSRPSPFCILDEVDAALDEGNIDRFVRMLGDFIQGSQFIIISHNKKTMMVADTIFGVTMQEPGVSKKISLQIEEAEEMAEAAAADEQAPVPEGEAPAEPEPGEGEAPAEPEAGEGEAPAEPEAGEGEAPAEPKTEPQPVTSTTRE